MANELVRAPSHDAFKKLGDWIKTRRASVRLRVVDVPGGNLFMCMIQTQWAVYTVTGESLEAIVEECCKHVDAQQEKDYVTKAVDVEGVEVTSEGEGGGDV